ncbi:hypothetical protein Q1695_013423 [Nippostrongylus brasiliensis]|nr:hypothetical protein Q1695_013423 [Nippostrongylus brasiliensis]
MAKALTYRCRVDGSFLNQDVLLNRAWTATRERNRDAKIELVLHRQSIVERIEIIAHSQHIPVRVTLATLENDREGTERHLGEVEFAAGSSGSDLLKTVYTDVRCTVVVLYVSAVEEGENSKEVHLLLIAVIEWLSQFATQCVFQVGLAGVQVFGRHEPAFEAKERYSSSAVTLSNGRFTPDMDELMRRLERKKNTFTEQKSQDEGAVLEAGGQTAVSEDVFYKTIRPQKDMEIQREGEVNSPGNVGDIHRPKNLFDREDFKPSTPKLFQPIDLSPSANVEPTELPRAPASAKSSRSSEKSLLVRKLSVPELPQIPSRTVSAGSTRNHTEPKRPSTSSGSRTSHASRRTAEIKRLVKDDLVQNKFLEKENTIVPALRDRLHRSDANEGKRQMSAEVDHLPLVPTGEPTEFSRAVELFGPGVVRGLYSKKWEERKNAITTVRQRLENIPPTEAAGYLDASVAVLQRHLKDPLHNVYVSVLELLNFICTRFIPQHNLHKMAPAVAKDLGRIILLRASDNDRRSAGETLSVVNEILEQDVKVAKAFLTRFLRSTVRGGQRGQATIVQNATESLGTPNAEVGLTEQAVTQYGLNCLRNADPEVRTIGKKLILDVYASGKRDVVFKLVSDEERMNRHPLLNSILDEMLLLNTTQQTRGASSTSQQSSSSKRPSTKSVRISNDLPKRNGDAQSSCQYCNTTIESADHGALEKHWQNSCPLFTKCNDCNQVIMVSSLATHRRSECRSRNNYRTCPRCGESVERSMFHRHVGRKDCRPTASYAAKCPLCAAHISPDNDEQWRRHLTVQCKENPRRRTSYEAKRNTSEPLSRGSSM